MIIRKMEASDTAVCIQIAHFSCKNGLSGSTGYHERGKKSVETILTSICESGRGYVAENDNKILGFLIQGHIWKDDSWKHVYIPTFGLGIQSGCDRVTVAQRLLKKHLEVELSEKVKTRYEIKVFENDSELVNALFYEQFGLISLEGIKKIESGILTENDGLTYRKRSTEEIIKEQKEILALYHELVLHLQQAPVFYKGEEFTDENFVEYILMEESRFYAAHDRNELIGILVASRNEDPIFIDANLYSVGDIYVKPKFRQSGIAKRLLDFAESDLLNSGMEWLHVDHGTANINARLFWDRYFEKVIFSMIRDIEPIL